MATFPVLNVQPLLPDWKESKAKDPTIRLETDGGYTVTAARFTRTPPKKYHLKYEPLTASEKTSLESLEDEVQVGAGIITWTNPFTAAVLDVRLAAPIEFRPFKGSPNLWTAEFDVEVV